MLLHKLTAECQGIGGTASPFPIGGHRLNVTRTQPLVAAGVRPYRHALECSHPRSPAHQRCGRAAARGSIPVLLMHPNARRGEPCRKSYVTRHGDAYRERK